MSVPFFLDALEREGVEERLYDAIRNAFISYDQVDARAMVEDILDEIEDEFEDR